MEKNTESKSRQCSWEEIKAVVPAHQLALWQELFELDARLACRAKDLWVYQRGRAAHHGGDLGSSSGYPRFTPGPSLGELPIARGSSPRPVKRPLPQWRDSEYALPRASSNSGPGPQAYEARRDGLLVSSPHYRLKTGAWSGGGNFYQFSVSQRHSLAGRGYYYKNGNWYDGPIGVVSPIPFVRLAGRATPYLQSWDAVRNDTAAYYASGYAKTRPGNPVASLGQFLAELRDLPSAPLLGSLRRAGKFNAPFRRLLRKYRLGNVAQLPGVLRSRHLQFRDLGSEYLNVVFGWEPFVRDLREMYNLWHVLDKRMAQIIRDNGRAIRRRAQVARESDVSVEADTLYGFPFAQMSLAPPNWPSLPAGTKYVNMTRRSTEVWWSGSYRYYIPDVGSSQWNRRARLALFGAIPSPALLWELLPYSWLIDWFTNVGDIASNLSVNAVDNLALNYSFVMRRESWERSCTATVWHEKRDDFGGIPPAKGSSAIGSWWRSLRGTAASTERWEIKSRVGGGSPFGLNITLPDLTARQWGILAALGISRQTLL